jgi:hypothetical protein
LEEDSLACGEMLELIRNMGSTLKIKSSKA